jgi:hypothetical protein
MRPVRNVFQKLSRTEQRREGVVAYLWVYPSAGYKASDCQCQNVLGSFPASSDTVESEVQNVSVSNNSKSIQKIGHVYGIMSIIHHTGVFSCLPYFFVLLQGLNAGTNNKFFFVCSFH